MKQGRETTQEERIQIVKDCLASGKNYGEMALKYKVSYQQVRTWTLRFEEMGEAGLEDRRGKRKKDQVPRTELEKAQIEIEQLKYKLYLAEMERDLLKKLDEIERREAFRKWDSAISMPRSGKLARKKGIPLSWPVNCSMWRARPTTNGSLES